MKRYWMFAGDFYYPSGGMLDFKGSYDSLDEAKSEMKFAVDWYHVFDTENKQVVESSHPW